jgi:hypothetical protein
MSLMFLILLILQNEELVDQDHQVLSGSSRFRMVLACPAR